MTAKYLFVLFAMLAPFVGTGCSRRPAVPRVTVGAKNFTEQIIVGEIMAQMIEGRTGLRVARRMNLGGTMICHTALTRGEIDLYAEYTGTALTAILKKDVITDPDLAYRAVKAVYDERFACEWLEPFGFNNTYTLTVREEFAEKEGLTTISDLAPLAADLTAGFTAEFAVREDGYPGMAEVYGFRFGHTRDMDPSLMVRAVARGDVDVICAFATDGRIAAYSLKILEDDKNYFPPYHAAPVVRRQVLDDYPQVREALAPLAGLLDDATMQKLNLEVDEEKREPAEVAKDFLTARELLSQPHAERVPERGRP